MNDLLHHIWCAIAMSLSMGWEMLWALVLGFTISAVIQAMVTKEKMSGWLAKKNIKSLTIATLFGAASSSCSYAATAIARSLIKQGADFSTAMAFQFASTNLVLELGILLAILLGWQFTAGEFVGGTIMIITMSLLFHFLVPAKVIREATEKAQKDVIAVPSIGKTAISHYFFLDWIMLWRDIVFGLLIAGILGSWVPDSSWAILLCKDNSAMAHWLNPLLGPLIAILSFVCSVGNIPLAAILWQSGMTFGGVLSFIFADLLVFPILNIYRKYYGLRMTAFMFCIFYASMVMAAYLCEGLFSLLGLIPNTRLSMPEMAGIGLNYTSLLNIIALLFTAVLFKQFVRSGGLALLKSKEGCCH